MANAFENTQVLVRGAADVERRFMAAVYRWMTFGLLVTAGVATVATLWGPFTREALAPARPRAWAERVEDVIPALENLGIPGV